MKIHLAWIQLTAAAAIVAGATAQPAVAQYPPFRPLPPKPAAPPIATQPAAAPAPQVPYVAYRQGSIQPPAQQYPATQYPATQYPTTQVQSAIPPYQPAVAPYRPSTAAIPQYPQTAAPAPANYGTYYVAQQVPPPTPPQGDAGAAAATNAAAGNGSAAQPTSPEGYANGVYSSSAYGYSTAGSSAGACASGCNYGCGDYASGCCDDCGYQSQWFGGVYFLFMERDNEHPRNLTVSVPDTATFPYWPSPTTNVLVSGDYGFEPGVEVRFGCTFTIGDSCDTCSTGCNSYGFGYGGCNNCAPCCKAPDVYAWEVGAWGLLEDDDDTIYLDQPAYGLYGMVNFNGLVYDRANDGYDATDTPVNGYYGYALPIPGASTEILAQRLRTNFQVSNLELNIMRFPVCDAGCGGCSSGCNSCGCDECNSLTYSAYGSCGVRYFRIDDEFFYATEFIGGGTQTAFDGWQYNIDNELFYDIEVDNNLIGPQLGWTMNYGYCKWNFFLNSTFGVFENHINSRQRMYSGGGGWAYFSQSGEQVNLSNSKDDISFLGELRLGGSYDVTCNWRAVLAYRAVAATGLATSAGQIPDNFANSTAVGIIDSDNSMIVHGVQVGAECRY